MPIFPAGEPVIFRGSVDLSKATTLSSSTDQIARSSILQRFDAEHPVELTELRVHDAPASFLPTTAAADDLGLIAGTFGTDAITVQTSDAKATTVTQRGRMFFDLPEEYVDNGSITLRLRAGMITTISDGTATVDVEAYAYDNDGSVGSDICATAAQTINSLTKADKDFVITSSGLSGGSRIDIRVTVSITDTGTATAIIGELSHAVMLLDVR